jgi:hypothetical protein
MVYDIYSPSSKASSAKRFFFFWSLPTGVRWFDLNVAAIDAVPVQGFDCLVRFGIAWHLDKTESFWSAGKPVFYYLDALNITEFGK